MIAELHPQLTVPVIVKNLGGLFMSHEAALAEYKKV